MTDIYSAFNKKYPTGRDYGPYFKTANFTQSKNKFGDDKDDVPFYSDIKYTKYRMYRTYKILRARLQ
jgi:hypothetical protein